ncbi:MAG: MFS transporter [Elusimicrobia bacterium]|nr:MFS transporter [Elusimicrobiota bacterium]
MKTGFAARLWALLVCQCVLVSGLALSYPFFALYLHRQRGLPMGLVGAALFAMLSATAVGQALGGELSDILGSKRVMEASVGARGLVVVLMSWAMAGGAAAGGLILLHVLGGFCGSFYDSAVRAWIAASCSERERLAAYGKLRVAVNLGWAVGPALGGLMAERSYPMLFAVSGAACLVCLAMVRWLVSSAAAARPESRFSWREAAGVAADRRFMRFCLFAGLIGAVMAQLVVSLSVHCVRYAGLSEARVGLLFTLNGVLVVLLQAPATQAARRLRLSAVLAAGCLFYAAGYGWVGFAGSFAALAAAVAVVTLGEITVSPGLHTMAVNLAPEKLRGRYLGFQGLSWQLGAAFGPLLGGLALQYLSPVWSAAPWLAVSLLAAAASWGFRDFGRRLNPREDGLYDEGLAQGALAEVMT